VTDTTYAVPGGTLGAYLATPAGPGPWPGVVVVHEVFGLTDDIRRQADRFAAAGYIALAPDLFGWGNTVRCLVATMRTMFTGHGRALDDIQSARTFLAQRTDCTGRVGVIGFCVGGGLAVLVSPAGFDVAAPNYGDVPKEAERILAGACPMVASYGGKDRRLKGTAGRLDAALTGLGVDHDVKEYPDAAHGFLFKHTGRAAVTEPLLVRYDAAAADDAWRRIFAFFERHLGEPHA
jgi:carboxymethylenebutenolidase